MRPAFAIALLFACLHAGADVGEKPTLLHTPEGIEFGVLGDKLAKPAPTLFVIALDLNRTLTDPDYNRVGMTLAKQGYLCVALDAPSHGKDSRENAPNALANWRTRITGGENIVAAFNAHCTKVLDQLIHDGYTDPNKVAVAGTSRGGFLALHWAAAEPRVRCVVGFAPVTELRALAEFRGAENDPLVRQLSLVNDSATVPNKLAGRPVWVWIGNDDERVGTDHAITFARRVARSSKTQGKPAPVELRVVQAAGHSVGPDAHPAAAAWIAKQIDTPRVEDVGDRACLFLDDRFVAEQSGLTRTFHQGRPLPQPAIVGDTWDRWPHLFGSVIFDPREKRYRMWYSSIREGIFYAESLDGKSWTKPRLGLIDADGSKDNNYVMSRVSLPNVLLDPNETDPAARFKLFAWDHAYYSKEPKKDRANGHTLFRSSDGIHWERVGQGIPGTLMTPEDRSPSFICPDTNQVIWDELAKRYLATFRTYPKRWENGEFNVGQRRSIGITSAAKITGPWEPIVTRLVPDEQDDTAAARAMRDVPETGPKWAEMYAMPMFTCGNHYIGLLSLIHIARGPDGAPIANAPGGGNLQLAFSHDGFNWHRPAERKSLIAPSSSPDLHATYAACSAPLEMGDEMWIYYAEQNASHPSKVNPTSQIRAAAWRKDGFASLDTTGDAPGTFTTPPLRFMGSRLELNVEMGKNGSAEVAILSADGSPIRGFNESACDKIKQSSVAQRISWNSQSDLTGLHGQTVRLRVTLRDARLFSFRFSG